MPSLGTAFQNGYVVPDLDAAMAHWTKVNGAGPFFVMPVEAPSEIRGEKVQIRCRIGLTYWNDFRIELIQPTDKGPNLYTEFLGRGRQGLQHIGVLTSDFEAKHKQLAQRGVPALMRGKWGDSDIAYYDTDHDFAGTLIELIGAAPPFLEMLELQKAAARNWDGKDPVRPLTALYE